MLRTAKLSSPDITPPTKVGQGKFFSIIIILTALLLIALSVAGYFYYQYRQSPKIQSAEEIKNLKEEIGAMFELPTDEEPTLATVTDREKLAEQPFFQKAENGDKVLIYSQSGRAILYRPSSGKIIDVTTVNVNTPTPAAEAAAPEAPLPTPDSSVVSAIPTIVRVALYNGSTTVGATNATEAKLKAALPNAAIVTKDKAAKSDYTKTVVVDVTGANGTTALSLASTLNGEVATLPEGETAPADADILVIVGNEE